MELTKEQLLKAGKWLATIGGFEFDLEEAGYSRCEVTIEDQADVWDSAREIHTTQACTYPGEGVSHKKHGQISNIDLDLDESDDWRLAAVVWGVENNHPEVRAAIEQGLEYMLGEEVEEAQKLVEGFAS